MLEALFFFLIKIFIEIIVDSRALVRTNTQRFHVAFTQFLPMHFSSSGASLLLNYSLHLVSHSFLR